MLHPFQDNDADLHGSEASIAIQVGQRGSPCHDVHRHGLGWKYWGDTWVADGSLLISQRPHLPTHKWWFIHVEYSQNCSKWDLLVIIHCTVVYSCMWMCIVNLLKSLLRKSPHQGYTTHVCAQSWPMRWACRIKLGKKLTKNGQMYVSNHQGQQLATMVINQDSRKSIKVGPYDPPQVGRPLVAMFSGLR